MKAAFFDVDGTLTKHRVWAGLLDYFKENRIRLGRYYFFSWVHYGLYGLHRLGLVSQVTFRSAWAKNLSWHFAGFTIQQAADIWEWVIENRLKGQWRTDIVELLKKHKRKGTKIFLVSGGPVGLLERIAAEVGGDFAVGTKHQIINGKYTGRSEGIACQGANKPLLVMEKIKELGLHIDLDYSYAYADSLADLQLLTLVGHPVAVYPDDNLREIALEKGWQILED
jgi:HAD superfamily hydrolase (TIGR01490 family)